MFQVELEFGNVGFSGGGPENPRTRATLVGGECYHH